MNNKIILLCFALLFIITVNNLYSQQVETKKIVKRTVLMLPFINVNKVQKYNYLSGTIKDALKTELLKTDYFLFVNQIDIDSIISKLKLTENDMENEINIYQLASKLKADVVVIGKYIIMEENIMIQIQAIDIFTKQTAASSSTKGELGLDIFRVIDDSAKDMSDRMLNKLKIVDKTYFEQMNEMLKKEEKLKLKKMLTPRLRTGIILTSIGGGLLLIGLPIMIYDLAGYSTEVTKKLYNNPRTDDGYKDYLNATYTYIGLFAGGLAGMGVGLVMLAVGIPLIIYDLKVKDKNVSLKTSCEDESLHLFCTIKL